MTATTTIPPRSRQGSLPPSNGMRLTANKPRRNTPLIAIGVLLMVGFGLAAAVLNIKAAERTAVLAVARPVAAGQVIHRGDLSTVKISVDKTLRPIKAAEASSVVGRSAAVSLLPGSLLTRAQIADSSRLPKGKVVIGLALKGGQLPTDGLRPGDQILVVATGAAANALNGDGSSSANTPQGAVLVRQATVYGVGSQDHGTDNTTNVSILVDEADAPALAGAGAAGQVTLVLRAVS
jgi:Flp pilus assembly protein CpaB